jgi:DNA-binding XRE family transcriptional regulator
LWGKPESAESRLVAAIFFACEKCWSRPIVTAFLFGGELMQRNRVRELRIAAGLSQDEAAMRSGLARSTFARIDQNPRCSIALDRARQIAQALDVEPLDLLPARTH